MAKTLAELMKEEYESEKSGEAKKSRTIRDLYAEDSIGSVSKEISSRLNTWLTNSNNYISNYQSRVKNRTGTYKDSYVSDSDKWLSTITTQKSNFDKEAENIKNLINQYKDYLDTDWVNSALSALDQSSTYHGDILKASTSDKDYWSQWEGEDAYNEWVSYEKDQEEKRNYDLKSAQEEMALLQEIIDLGDEAKQATYPTDKAVKTNLHYQKVKEYTSKYGDITGNAVEYLATKKKYYNEAKLLQESEAVQGANDFREYSQKGASIENPTHSDAEGWLYAFGHRFGADDVGNIVTYSRENADLIQGDVAQGYAVVGDYRYRYMTDDEVNIYNYYLSKEGEKKASEYLSSIYDTLVRREAGKMYERMEDNTALELAFGITAGLDQFASGVRNNFLDDDKIQTSATQYASGMVREDLADNGFKLPEWLGGASIAQAGYDLVTNTSNMLPSMLVSSVTGSPLVGASILGLSAAGNARAEMLSLGYGDNEARAYGAMVGASEAGLQYLLGGVSKLGGKLSNGVVKNILSKIDNAYARVALQLGGNMLSEGFEEGLQTVIEPWLKSLATGTDFEAPNIDEVLYSGLLGAVTSFGLEGVTTTANAVSTHVTGNSIKNAEGAVAHLVEAGKTFDVNSVAYKMANKVTPKTGAFTIGTLYNEIGASLSEQNINDIATALENTGMDKDTAMKLAKGFDAAVDGLEFTELQEAALENNPVLTGVIINKLIDENLTQYERDAISKTKLANAEAVGNAQSQVLQRTAGYKQALFDVAVSNVTKNAKTSDTKAKTEVKTIDGKDLHKEVNTEGKVSETNTTTQISTGEAVVIDKSNPIHHTEGKGEDLKIFFNTDKGVVEATDISYASENDALVYESFVDLGSHIANAVIKNYKGQMPIQDYADGMRKGILMYGKYNFQGKGKDIHTESEFTALSEADQQFALNLGRTMSKTSATNANTAIRTAIAEATAEMEAKGEKATPKQGKVRFEEGVSATRKDQQTAVRVAEIVARATGRDVVFYDSKTTKDEYGKGSNGYFDPKDGSIHLDLQNSWSDRKTILFTLSHELVHFAKAFNPVEFQEFADFLVKEYGKHGVDVEELVRIKMGQNKKLDYDAAFEEVIADACERFLVDSNAIEKLNALGEKTWVEKIIDKIMEFIKDIRDAYALYTGVEEAQKANKMTDVLDELQAKFESMVVGAAQTSQDMATVGVTLQQALEGVDIDGDLTTHKMSIKSVVEGADLVFDSIDGKHFVVKNRNGEKVTSVTKEHMKKTPLGNLVSIAVDNGNITAKEAEKQYGYLADIVNMCLEYRDSALVWEVAGTTVFSALKNNSDTQYGTTIDFSTICKKTQAIIDAMSETMVRLGRGLTRAEVEEVYYQVGLAGEETPCPVCYVFSRWMGIGGILDQMRRFQDEFKNSSEAELIAYMEEIESRIKKRAYAPNKKGNLVADFFDKNGNVKQGTVLSKLKAEASSKATSALKKLAKNGDYKLKIQELETLLESQDDKGRKATLKKIESLKKKLINEADVRRTMQEANDTVEEYEKYQWLAATMLEEVVETDENGKNKQHIGWTLNKDFKAVPNEILLDLNKGDEFASNYPYSWKFRTTKGCAAGKAILPYSDARVGETIKGIASGVDNIDVGYDLNAFLNGDKESQAKIVASAIEKMRRQNLIGGQRYQSTSDFRYEYGSDYLITFLEMQAIGAKVQLYTKVIEAVDFLASVGCDCNLSVMPLGDGFIVMEDGTKKLVYSSVTGINAEAAIAKSREYNNVQLILVGISDEHIRLALEGTDVTFVIPFHGSGNTVHQIQALMNLLGEDLDVNSAQDYTDVQSDHHKSKKTAEQKALWELRCKIISRSYEDSSKKRHSWDGKLSASEKALLESKNGRFLKDLYNRFYEDETADEYGVSLSKAQSEQIFPYEYWDKSLDYDHADQNGERFKEYCETMGIIPRFSGINSKGKSVGFGDFTNAKGYWKLLIDRPMYNNKYDSDGNWIGYGEYHKQKAINVTNARIDTLDPAYGTATFGEVMSKRNDPSKTSKIVDNVVAQLEGDGIKHQQKTPTETAQDLVNYVRGEIKRVGSWDGHEVFDFFKDKDDINFVERIYAKDKDAKKDLAEFLSKIDDVKLLDRYAWFVGEAYKDKDRVFDFFTGKANYPYRGSVATFKNAIKKRINDIESEKVGGHNLGVKNGEISLKDAKALFDSLNSDKEIGEFAEKVFATCEKLGVNIRFANQVFSNNKVAGDALGDMVELKTSYFNDRAYSDQRKASTILHELIHSCTVYVMTYDKTAGDVTYGDPEYDKIANAATRLNRIYLQIANDPDFRGQYGLKSPIEMVAELANPEFVALMKKKTLWDSIVDWICKLFGYRRGNSAYENARMCVDYMLDNPAIMEYKAHAIKMREAAWREGYKPFGKTVTEDGRVKYQKKDSYAPTFYSQMGKTIDGIKMEKIGASSVVPFLKGKGIRHDEIKWSGIEAFLEGKKSVTKAELQEFVAGSSLQIEEEVRGETIKYTEDEQMRLDELSERNSRIFDEVVEIWEDLFGEEIPFDAYDTDVLATTARRKVESKDLGDTEDGKRLIQLSKSLVRNETAMENIRKSTRQEVAKWGDYKLEGGENYRELVFSMPDSDYSNRAMRGHWGTDAKGILVHARIQDFETDSGKMLFIEEIQSDWHNEGREKGYTTKEYEDAVAVYDKLAEDYANKRRAFNKYVRSSEFRSDPDDVSNKKFNWLRSKMDTAEKRMQDAERDVNALKEKGMGDTPDAPFRDNYHEYVLKRLIRMAAEEGYDSIGWTPAYIQEDRWSEDYAEGYRIEYDQDIPKFLKKYGKKWGAVVGKDTITVSTDVQEYGYEPVEVWSMPITESMEQAVLYEGQPKFQMKQPTNRTILANALESTIDTSTQEGQNQLNILKRYKDNVSKIEELEYELASIKAEIHKLSFGEGERDMKKLRDLQHEKSMAENRLNTFDRRLLELEATKPMKDLLKREKELVRKRYEKEGRELMRTAVKERTESIKTREARKKLQALVLDTSRWLRSPTKTEVQCPDFLKKPFAELLESIDMSSKKSLAGKGETKGDVRLDIAMTRLANAIEKIEQSQDSTSDKNILTSGYLDLPENFVENLRHQADKITEYMGWANDYQFLNEMSIDEIKYLTNHIKTLRHSINEMQKLYTNYRFANAITLGQNTCEFIDSLGEDGAKLAGLRDFLAWENGIPYYVFKRFGEAGISVFESFMDAQDKLAFLANEIIKFRESTWKESEAKKWSNDVHTIELTGGKKITLTTAHAMGLYCLSQREHAIGHLEGFGIRVVSSEKELKNAKNLEAILSEDDMKIIAKSIEGRPQEVADKIQDFFSVVCAKWGNEISMKRFLTEMFLEKKYYPIESDPDSLTTKDPEAKKSDLFRLLNISATKPLTEGANNRIIIRNIFDVFTAHTSDMARLNSYGMAILDYMKWMNYQEKIVDKEGKPVDTKGVRRGIRTAYGDAAQKYLLNLIKDINGTENGGRGIAWLDKTFSNAKVAAVGGNLRVVLLQMTSYPRAALILSPKSLALGLRKKPSFNKAKKYCGTVLWKSMGFYDTDVARGLEGQIKGNESAVDKIKEMSLWGAGKADEITLGYLWNACEYEVAKSKQYKVGTEEFNKAVAKKLREVIYSTQVVDSVLARSQMMRSKNSFVKAATSFMSEPTMTANATLDCAMQFEIAKRQTGSAKVAFAKTKKQIGRTIATTMVTTLLVALAGGLFDAFRDDDDEPVEDKMTEAFVGNLLQELIPLGRIPILSDITGLIASKFGVGYSSTESLDKAWLNSISKAWDAWVSIFNKDETDDKTLYYAIYNTAKVPSQLFGIPFANAMREVVTLWNTTAGSANPNLKFRTWNPSASVDAENLYQAIVNDDQSWIDDIMKKFDSEEELSKAMKTVIKSHYVAGDIDYDTAYQYLKKYCVFKDGDDELYWYMDKLEYAAENDGETEGYEKYDDFIVAVETGSNLKQVINNYIDKGVSKESLASQITKHFKPLYKEMTNSERARLKGYLLNAYEQLGYKRSDRSKAIDKWLKEDKED